MGSANYPLRSSTGRLSLQPLTAEEISHVERWFRVPETCELAFGVKAPREVLESIRTEYIAELHKDKVGVLSIRLDTSKPNSEIIGFVRYKLFHKQKQVNARVGILLGPNELRGQGIGRDALNTLLSYLFEKRGVATIELDTATFNTAAQHCFLACGFEKLREVEFTSISTQWTERRIVMRLTRSNWFSLFPGENG